MLGLCSNENDANAGIDLKHVDVEVDGWVEGGEEVGYTGHIFHPGRPDHLLVVDVDIKCGEKPDHLLLRKN